jgi:CelD/BcsL family acetyltransferase involved in cellulose biosynthesis
VLGIEVRSTDDTIRELAAEWDALCDASPQSTPFQRPAWVLAWMRHTRPTRPIVLALRCGRDLVGVAPLFAWGARATTLSLLGAGISDHLDTVVAPGFEQGALDALAEWLEGALEPWSACVFDEIGPRALLGNLRCPPGKHLIAEPQSVCPVLALGPGQNDIERVVPPHQAARLRKYRRRAARAASLEFERADRHDRAGGLRSLFALHERRWEGRGEPGVLCDPSIRAMHEDAAAGFDARRLLRLYVLRIDGRPAAAIYGFRDRNDLYLYLQGLEPTLAWANPGMLLVGAVLEDALSEGVMRVDFLRGAEPYKYAWGARDEVNMRVRIERTSE